MTSPDKLQDPVQYEADVQKVCQTYQAAEDLYKNQRTHVVCCDEKTGIQAKARKYTTKPTLPKRTEKREFEYIRHGTINLILSFHVAQGAVLFPTLCERRTNDDFLEHIRATIAVDPQARFVFIVDRLNTHMSCDLVRFVAQQCGIGEEVLGQDHKRGTLKNMKTRRAFLEEESHRIRFVYTPRHASWLNQVEIWFSILTRRLLKRASFNSQEDLAMRILDFVDYFNEILAKPFQWTYKGRLLKA